MPIPIFDLICDRIKPLIQKQHTRLRSPIDPEDRLEATLQFLVSGIAYSRLQWSAVMHETTPGKEFIKFPTSDEEWEEISKDFLTEGHCPKCIGATSFTASPPHKCRAASQPCGSREMSHRSMRHAT